MVDGCMNEARLAVIDLDGTLVRGNTFHVYLRLGLGEALRGGHLWRAMRLSCLMGLRALRLIPHTRLKFGSLSLIEPTQALQHKFAVRVNSMKNKEVERLIAAYEAEGARILLATAAPAVYVPWIWAGDYVATTGRTELRGEAKLKAVREYMSRNGLSLYAVVTDHEDDLPLLQAGAIHNVVISG